MGTQTWQQALQNIWVSLLGSFIDFVTQMAVEWAAKQIAKLIITQATNVPEAASNAAVAATAAMASVAAIPFVGWAMAPAVGAQTYAMAMGFASMAAAEKGFDIPAGVNPITQLHQKEMVLPSPLADGVRDMIAKAGGVDQPAATVQGGDTYHVTIQATDARSFQRLLHENGHVIVQAVNKQARGFNKVKV
jgi:hypothetical protein